jgi:hypothetical protein
MSDETKFDWRKHLSVHEAAGLFPMLPEAELKDLADDIKANGLQAPILLYRGKTGRARPELLDGRNRLDALALLGWLRPQRGRCKSEREAKYNEFRQDNPFIICDDHDDCGLDDDAKFIHDDDAHFRVVDADDPVPIAISINIRRRHLKPEERRDLIAKLLKADPEQSNRQVAEQVGVDHKTVASIRTEAEARGEIPHVETRTDKQGRQQPAKKARPAPPPPVGEVVMPTAPPPEEAPPVVPTEQGPVPMPIEVPPPDNETVEYERLVAAWDSAGRTAKVLFIKHIRYEAEVAALDSEPSTQTVQ